MPRPGMCHVWPRWPSFLEYNEFVETNVNMVNEHPTADPFRSRLGSSATRTGSCSSSPRRAKVMVVDATDIIPAEDFNISNALVEWDVKPLCTPRRFAKLSCEVYPSNCNWMATSAMRRLV